jgi:predicted AAA+ superfamily ATPase
MIKREMQERLYGAIEAMPVVALLGPRQVGKTTLAIEVSHRVKKKSKLLGFRIR